MAVKTYELLEHTKPTAPIFMQVNKDQRVKFDVLPLWEPYLIYTFTDKDGKNKTIRLKFNTNEIDQAQQIKDGILANVGFTQQEKNSVKFINGRLSTANETVQRFLESCPEYEGFDGIRTGEFRAMFRQLVVKDKVKLENTDFKKRVSASNVIVAITDVEQAYELMQLLNGEGDIPKPEDIEEAQNKLVVFLDQADDEGLDAIINFKSKLTTVVKEPVKEEKKIEETKNTDKKEADKADKK